MALGRFLGLGVAAIAAASIVGATTAALNKIEEPHSIETLPPLAHRNHAKALVDLNRLTQQAERAVADTSADYFAAERALRMALIAADDLEIEREDAKNALKGHLSIVEPLMHMADSITNAKNLLERNDNGLSPAVEIKLGEAVVFSQRYLKSATGKPTELRVKWEGGVKRRLVALLDEINRRLKQHNYSNKEPLITYKDTFESLLNSL